MSHSLCDIGYVSTNDQMIQSNVVPPIMNQMSMQQKVTCRNSAYAYGMHLQSHMPHMISVSCLCPCRVKLNDHFLKWADKINSKIEKLGVIFGNPNFFEGELNKWLHSLGNFRWPFCKLDKKRIEHVISKWEKSFQILKFEKVLLETF